jgi:uncharacterized cupin superfamily protein
MKTLPHIATLDVPNAQLASWPLPADAITQGEPRAAGVVLHKSDDVRIVNGIWACSPGQFRWNWSYDETVVVVEGRATVTTGDGRRVELEPGSMAFFERGTESLWTIHEPFRKGFHALSPEPLPF